MSAKMTTESSTDPASATSNWLIDDDFPDANIEVGSADEPWRVLIIDDDVDVHVVTKFSLSNASFMGRRLSFLHAYSAAEALDVLRSTPDIAMVLLDVIMETDDAGLRVVRQIRDELGNKLVRIVLRTGQPGQALEHSIILDYDINDFWCKTDLTTRKLFTTVIASLRAYAHLQSTERSIVALRAALVHSRRLRAALEQHTLLLQLDKDGNIIEAGDSFCAAFDYQQQSPQQSAQTTLPNLVPNTLLGHKIPCPAEQQADIARKLAQGASWSADVILQAFDGSAQQVRAMFVPLGSAADNAHNADQPIFGNWLFTATMQSIDIDAN
jgi:CheY-like chemotaxis protein